MSIGLLNDHNFEESMQKTKRSLTNLWIAFRFVILCAGFFQLGQLTVWILKIATRP